MIWRSEYGTKGENEQSRRSIRGTLCVTTRGLPSGMKVMGHESTQTAQSTNREQEPNKQQRQHGRDVRVAILGRVASKVTPLLSTPPHLQVLDLLVDLSPTGA